MTSNSQPLDEQLYTMSSEEQQQIHIVMSEHQIRGEDLAFRLRISRSLASRLINGKASLTPQYRYILYAALEEDSRLNFLIEGLPEDAFYQHPSFFPYTERLNRAYLRAPLLARGRLLHYIEQWLKLHEKKQKG